MGFKKKAASLERARNKRLAVERLDKLTDNEIAQRFTIAGKGFLRTREWKELRNKVLDFYGCTCMRCGYVAPTRKHINVDHIKNRRDYPHLALSFSNTQVLCPPCNKKKGNKHETDYRPNQQGLDEYSDESIRNMLKNL